MTFKLNSGNNRSVASANPTQKSAIELPSERTPAKRQSPARLLIYGMPKIGKTTAISNLDDCFLLELDPRGVDHLSFFGLKIDSYQMLLDVADEIIKRGKPYKYVAVDTLTILEEWCEKEALKLYKKHPAGAKFVGDNVLILDYGQGYLWLRTAWDIIMRKLETIAENLIFVAHLRDREISSGGTALTSKEIQLTGKIREITCAKVDAIAFIKRKADGKNYISFKPKASENIICSARARHLSDKEFVLSEYIDGKLVTHWEEIYID